MTISRALWIALFLLGLGGALRGQEPGVPRDPRGFAKAAPGYPWAFPEDHSAHPDYEIEWWYFTGILRAPGSLKPQFGYQFTLFRVGLEPGLAPKGPERSSFRTRGMVMGHAALTHIPSKSHHFAETLRRQSDLFGRFPAYPSKLLGWCQAPTGHPGQWKLFRKGEGFSIEVTSPEFEYRLELSPEKPRIFQGPDGLSRKSGSEETASLYYSYPRLKTQGELRFGGQTQSLVGTTWMDKEISSGTLGSSQVGWDWFSLRFEDGSDLMLYELRREDQSVDHASGTFVDPEGKVHYLEAKDWKLERLEFWDRPDSKVQYPVAWTLEVPGRIPRVTIRALVPESENRSRLLPGMAYWEGPVSVQGSQGEAFGEGFVEMTGVGGSRRPAR